MSEYDELERLIRGVSPVLEPSAHFREALGYRLFLTAEEFIPKAGVFQPPHPRLASKGLLLGTAALSIMGAAFFLWRARGVQGPHDPALVGATGD